MFQVIRTAVQSAVLISHTCVYNRNYSKRSMHSPLGRSKG